jgi:hypothetical protein
MARKRSLPTTLFASPDFFELSSNTVRLIFIGLILDADDDGRGLAHTRLLARKLDQAPEEIDQALDELANRGMLRCYEVAERRFYWLCHWHTYQTLSKPTPSHYPPPPDQRQLDQPAPSTSLLPAESQASQQESREEEHQEPACVSFNAQVAATLHLPESADLRTIVREFADMSSHALLGEAIEARAWIDDQRRNTRQQIMTPAFFRRWLRRSQQQEDAATSASLPGKSTVPAASPTHVPDQYEIYVKALQARYSDPAALQEVC